MAFFGSAVLFAFLVCGASATGEAACGEDEVLAKKTAVQPHAQPDSFVEATARKTSPRRASTVDFNPCKPEGRWAPPFGEDGKQQVDLVVSWYTYKQQSQIHQGAEQNQISDSSLLVSAQENFTEQQKNTSATERRKRSRFLGARQHVAPASQDGNASSTAFENQAEIMYELRSFEKHGLLNNVRNLVLLMDSKILKEFGAPRNFDYTNKERPIRIVTERDLGFDFTDIPDHGFLPWSKWLRMHTIPGLSDNFIYVPDDNVLLKKFDPSMFWDAGKGKPIIYSFGSVTSGWCGPEGGAVGGGHGPVLINKCAMEQVAARFPERFAGGKVDEHREATDGICVYSNSMNSNDECVFKGYGQDGFFQECHTNGGCNLRDAYSARHTAFMNVQGNGISDEYPSSPSDLADAANIYHTEYPSPSRFERQ